LGRPHAGRACVSCVSVSMHALTCPAGKQTRREEMFADIRQFSQVQRRCAAAAAQRRMAVPSRAMPCAASRVRVQGNSVVRP
jgi:hypothetical protein